MGIYKPSEIDGGSALPVNPEKSVRRAIYDFAVLSVITQLILAFLYPDNYVLFLWLSLPYLIVAILSKMENNAVYPVTSIIAAISIMIGMINGDFLNSLKEWGVFFREGQNLRFLELSHLILLTNYIGMGYYSMKKYFSK